MGGRVGEAATEPKMDTGGRHFRRTHGNTSIGE